MNFGQAIESLTNGHKVARAGWNGNGMYLILVTAWIPTQLRLNSWGYPPFIGLNTVTGTLVPWLASQTDMLADDWEFA